LITNGLLVYIKNMQGDVICATTSNRPTSLAWKRLRRSWNSKRKDTRDFRNWSAMFVEQAIHQPTCKWKLFCGKWRLDTCIRYAFSKSPQKLRKRLHSVQLWMRTIMLH